MAKEDEILTAFMSHPLLKEKYGIKEEELPNTIKNGMSSKYPIIVAITNIVKGQQRIPAVTDSEIQRQLFEILNKTAL
jgi:hypothetical protein